MPIGLCGNSQSTTRAENGRKRHPDGLSHVEDHSRHAAGMALPLQAHSGGLQVLGAGRKKACDGTKLSKARHSRVKLPHVSYRDPGTSIELCRASAETPPASSRPRRPAAGAVERRYSGLEVEDDEGVTGWTS